MSKLDEVLAQTSWAGKEQSSKIDQALSKTSWGEPATDSNIFYEDGKLMKSDLKTGTNATTIRDYMIDRFGQDYRYNGKITDNDMVEDFFNHMRSFNTNLLQTAGEVRYVSKADDAQKARADAAFRLYDQTGNVFVNDGFFGAIDGIGDYIKAAASAKVLDQTVVQVDGVVDHNQESRAIVCKMYRSVNLLLQIGNV